ncbi:hypothetical protein PSI15_10100 [Xenorhabdus sp. PR6a]|uniref:hypothetical protein n=1 Tax=Xenorhabdus sp. PR6a TaxID=3025877 RepID=UPI002358EFFB|nr:hypothetical protein [Xenorhabdus sp. PR6a]MDC9581912.1 hypothetical protein [Xenorhabdus sp. PR6a]
MITSLINKGVTVTPTDLAKELVSMYGRSGLGRVRTILSQNEIKVTERELALVHSHCMTMYNRICRKLNQNCFEPEQLATIYPLEKASA